MTIHRLLLVDDDISIRLVAQASLEHTGVWRVSTADSGAQALEMARDVTKKRPDVILLDVMMPEMDGPTTLSHLRANPRTQEVPVIFLTGSSHSAVEDRWPDQAVAGVLTKPFDPLLLSDQIIDLLGWGA